MAERHTALLDADGIPEAAASTAMVPWWSFTKTLLAAAALRLVENGRLALDDRIAGRRYTLRQLLQHRAGLGNYGTLPEYDAAVARGDDPWSEVELFRHVPPDRLLFEPGTGWVYSNVGYFIVRRLIEAASGSSLQEALARLVLEPLDLRASRLAATREDMRASAFAVGRAYHPGWAFHGIVIGPVVEAALALHRLLRGDLLTDASRCALLERHPIGGPVAGRPWLATGYGLGLMTGTMRAGDFQPISVVGHTAGGPGSVGGVYQRCDDGRTVAVFAAGSDEGAAEAEAFAQLMSR